MSTQAKLQGQYRSLIWQLLGSQPVHIGEWQSKDVSNSALHATYELLNTTLDYAIPDNIPDLQDQVKPNLPWAENHFRERTGGEPLNPGVEYQNWPWYKGNVEEHKGTGVFSHTYMERFWPKRANPDETMIFQSGRPAEVNVGIRFAYGDLQDVVDLLIKSPLTRQAYLPVWFPEDTGAVHGERVPCSLGYHFMMRDGRLHCWYSMRSCDILRHFLDDVYLAARLVQWVCKQYNGREVGFNSEEDYLIKPGNLHMTISSLHAFLGDKWKLEQILDTPQSLEIPV